MFKYTLWISDPENSEDINIYHDKEFTKEEFQKICEDAILYSFKIDLFKRKMFFRSSISEKYVIEYLLNLNFKLEECEESKQFYNFDGFNPEKIKNEELRDMLINTKKYVKGIL